MRIWLRRPPSRYHFARVDAVLRPAAAWAWRVAAYGWPSTLLYPVGGIGDDLLCTIIFRELHQRGQRRMWMISRYPELFWGNPNVTTALAHRSEWFERQVAQRIHPIYSHYDREHDRDEVPDRHIILKMCEAAHIHGRVALRPDIYLTPAERDAGRVGKAQVAVQSGSLASFNPMFTKQWDAHRMQAVVDRLKDRFQVVQLGMLTDHPLSSVTDLRGKTTLRQAAAVLSQSMLFIGIVGFFMHLARAVDCRAVIVYGAREAPWQSGYGCFENLYTPIECSPCWLRSNCPHDMECMRRITAADVVAAAERQLAGGSPGEPLPVDVGELESAPAGSGI